jgi:DNA-binding NtrC family response regulator
MVSRRFTILAVDDEPDACMNLADILTDLGFHVDVACDGQSALELVRQHAYDVALLDLKMPGMSGLELYGHIKQIRAGTVAVIVTAYASEATAYAAIDAGAWRIVSKPVDAQLLIKTVEEAVDQPLVMVVDDDADLCDSLWALFREYGFRTCLAHSLNEATRQLRDTSLQVALIDMTLADGDGRQVYQLVRQTNPQARTVIVTGHRGETEQLVRQVLAEGADAVCYKPFDVQSLIETVQRLTR